MKFNKCPWLFHEGVVPTTPARTHEIESDKEGVTVFLSTSRDGERGTMIGGSLFTVRYTSPMPGIIRVQVEHFKGRKARMPEFDLTPHPNVRGTVVQTEETVSFTSGPLSVRAGAAKPWFCDFLGDGRVLTSSKPASLSLMKTNDTVYLREKLSLGVGELIYGLGERFGPLVKNGQSIDIWNEDVGTSTELAYKNIPFYLSSNGYGILVNHPDRVSFEVASQDINSVQFSVEGHSLDYFVIYGPTPGEVLERYTALTGRPALPPAWSFGLWLTTSFVTEYDEKTTGVHIQGMADRDIPLHVFHFDCFWMRGYRWCDFEWDPQCFPDPAGMLRRLKAKGLRICLWINPYIGERSSMFEEGMRHGFLLKRPNGDVYQTDAWQPGMALVDFTNPGAVTWYADKLRQLLDDGVDAFKTDFGENIPLDVAYHDGSDPKRMHNYYTYLYNKTVYEVLAERFGENGAVLYARSATVGGQKFPVHWGGDCYATFESMAETLRGGLSLGMCGFGFWSHDMGGFDQTATPDIYKRWCAFGLLSSHSRLHGNATSRVPWLFDEESVDVLRFFTKQKCRLMPYLYGAAVEAHEKGRPVLRSMFYQYPNDPACRHLDQQYMLGPGLLVAPVFSESGDVEYYLPAGRWTHFLTEETTDGSTWRKEKLGFMEIPMWVPENTVIPVGADEDKPDYEYANGVTLHIFPMSDGAEISVTIPDLQGVVSAIFRCTRAGKTLRVVRERGSAPWNVLLRGLPGQKPHPVEHSEIHLELGM
ncbi:MAG: alpha-xylosidase [Verrucomicrobia bacterium]|nr:alpha-xylosidase [Verrucomicrobiota bacterium]MCH8526155.1 alpha-xylosidase [Kiritimatiellia bacterium]